MVGLPGAYCGCKLGGLLNILYIGFLTTVLILTTAVTSLFSKEKTIRLNSSGRRKRTLAFFHPYCNAGGGGERVLWAALRTLQNHYSSDLHHFVIFTGDTSATPSEILAKCRNNFNINLDPGNLEFIFLKRRDWIEAGPYPVLTLLGQSIGSMYLGLEALGEFKPDVYLDTMGYAFTLPLFKWWGGARVGAYVHYPTISTDMLGRVEEGREMYNNEGGGGKFKRELKLVYYKWFSWVYGWCGGCCEVAMVNSSWTEGHIERLWGGGGKGRILKVYPPCDVEEFKGIRGRGRKVGGVVKVISVAQFRPEKDHAMQVRMMGELRRVLGEGEMWGRMRLVLLGSVRNEGDRERVEGLKRLVEELGVGENVVWRENFSFELLKEEMEEGMIGVHTMLDEHFGISVVECMAAGLIMLAHRSGGPKMDIVREEPEGERTGFLAESAEEYAQQIKRVLGLDEKEREEIRERARRSVERFSDEQFGKKFLEALEPLMQVDEYGDMEGDKNE